MRTKALLGLAALAAGLATAAAQNVYSLNVVGYYNVSAPAGYTLMANQLNTGGNTLNEVLPNTPNDTIVLTFKNNVYNWDIAQDGAWYDYNTTEPSTTVVPPGTGFFYNNLGSARTVTFVGEVPQGTLAIALGSGYTLIGSATPQQLDLSAAGGNNFPQQNDSLILTFANNIYTWNINQDGAWYDYNTTEPVTMAPAVGQGFFYNNLSSATTWTRNFTVQ